MNEARHRGIGIIIIVGNLFQAEASDDSSPEARRPFIVVTFQLIQTIFATRPR